MRDKRPGAEKNDHDEAERREDDEDRLIGDALIVPSHLRFSDGPRSARFIQAERASPRHAPKKITRR